jgi:hypothetical protein
LRPWRLIALPFSHPCFWSCDAAHPPTHSSMFNCISYLDHGICYIKTCKSRDFHGQPTSHHNSAILSSWKAAIKGSLESDFSWPTNFLLMAR